MHAGYGTMKLIADHAGADDWAHDPYGTASNLAFDICEALDASDIEGDVSPAPFAAWQYQRGAAVAVPSLESLAYDSETAYGAAGLAQALLDGDITQADLIYAGNVLDRYISLLTAAGRDY